MITIAGVDRTEDIKYTGFTITQHLTHTEDDCSFTIKSGSRPTEGDEIIITEGAIKLFAGIVNVVKDIDLGGLVVYSCKARDYTYQLDKLFVVEEYEDTAADAIVKDILAKYCVGFSDAGVASGAPVVEYQPFDDVKPSDCLKELAEYVGWQWYVDYGKVVHFFNPADRAEAAPLKLEPGAAFRKFGRDIDILGLANRVRVRGGNMPSDPITHTIVADGKARIWILPHKPKEMQMLVNAVPVTVGIENIHEEGTFNYYVNYQEKYVRADESTGTIADGTTITFIYKFDIFVITIVEDFKSQAAVAAVQGGDGAYEYVIKDDTLETLEAAEAAGNQYLREHANPKVSGTFETEVGGWKPGQLVVINLPDQGIQGTYMVQRITVRNLDQAEQTYNIQWGGRLLGIADFLRALVAKEQKKRLAETTLLSKYAYGLESVEVADEMEGTPRFPPWYCGQADALCGFVVASPAVAHFLMPAFALEVKPAI